jgi:hypothetical protein
VQWIRGSRGRRLGSGFWFWSIRLGSEVWRLVLGSGFGLSIWGLGSGFWVLVLVYLSGVWGLGSGFGLSVWGLGSGICVLVLGYTLASRSNLSPRRPHVSDELALDPTYGCQIG